MDHEQKLDEIITAYLRAVEAGEPVDQTEWLTRYPDLADELAEFFASQQSVERVAAPLRGAAGSAAPAGAPPAPREQADAPTVSSQVGDRSVRPGDRVRYFGDYELLEEVARGGMGVVYKVRQVSLNRIVALKMILAGNLAGKEDVKRFHREAQAAANLDHPNVVPIYEVGEHQGLHYFTMKLIDGASLARRTADIVRDPKAAVTLLAKVARAVHDAHQHGILHRDLKPSNILVDASGEPHVADFGLARRIDGRSPETRTGAIIGTPSYLSPEQARSEKSLTVAVDVYGLGAILYELLTGRPPFRAESELETILQVLDRDPPPPRTLNPRIDRDLETICLKCLEKEPGNRYASALALAEDLERWQAGHSIQARPSGPARKVWKWTKRNPTLAILLVVLPLWYFNVRLPWQWAWLNWILLGMIMLPGLTSIVALVRRALGKPGAEPFNLVNDVYVLPAVVLACLVLVFYPDEIDIRRTIAYGIVLTALSWGFGTQWWWRRRSAGNLSLAVRTPRQIAIPLGICFGALALMEPFKLVDHIQDGKNIVAEVVSSFSSVSSFAFLCLLLIVGIEMRAHGCLTFFRFVRWQDIESYTWKATSRDYALLTLAMCGNPVGLIKPVPRPHVDAIDRILKERGLQPGPDMPPLEVAAPVLAPGERSPADRLSGPALLLMWSAVMQISAAVLAVGVLMFARAEFEQPWLVWPIATLLGTAGAAVGIVVFAGAVKMRGLSDYRFCRMSAIVAMLPLGAGFILGMPFGIWALAVLKRPDVRAAFAGGDNHGP